MKIKNVLVLGFFGYNTNQLDGQTIKTRSIYQLLVNKCEYGQTVSYFDTQDFKSRKSRVFIMLKECWTADRVFYIPAHNNLKFFFPFLYFISLLRGSKIYYVVVGGWLAEFLSDKPLHRFLLKRIAHILPQTQQLVNQLESRYGISNVTRLHNYRIHNFKPNFTPVKDVIKMVFMARVHPQKGVSELFHLEEYLSKRNIENFIIDIYGQVTTSFEEEFRNLLSFSTRIRYKGGIEPSNIYEVLSDYDLMLLPTKFYTEGFPGSILDAYIAGIPVVVSKWKYANDFIDEGKSGMTFEFLNSRSFFDTVHLLIEDPSMINNMKRDVLEEANKYTSEAAWRVLEGIMYKEAKPTTSEL